MQLHSDFRFRRPVIVATRQQRCMSSSSGGSDIEDPNKAKKGTVDPRLSEWIPPNRPLVGDKGYSHLYENEDDDTSNRAFAEEEELAGIEREVKLLEDEEGLTEDEQLERIEQELRTMDKEERKKAPSNKKKKEPVKPQQMDWLQTRRQQLGDDLTPSFEQPGQSLPVLHHTLLTAQEIMDFLSSLGGMYPNLVEDKVKNAHGDTRMGGAFKGIIFVSGNSTAHVRMLATSLVEQLKRRKLNEVGVMGARHGAEGSDDADETWFCIDCHNYVVNIQDEETRRTLNLEGWWSKADPMAEYRAASKGDEDEAMDEFVAKNPVPPNYGRSSASSWSNTISSLQQKRYTAPHKQVERPDGSGRKKRGGKGRRRT